MLAVLEDAVATVGRGAGGSVTSADRRALDEVRRWCSSEDRSWPFSFLNVCETLGFDAARLRSGLASWSRGPDDATGRCRPPRIRRLTGDRTRVVLSPTRSAAA